MKRTELVNYLNKLLAVSTIHDYCPNGLQVEGREEIHKIVTGVTACQALIDAAIEAGADAIIVHHGFFWKNENPVLTGMKKKRLGALLKHDINLLGYHLPLDAHLTLGNNIQLAHRLGWPVDGRLSEQGDAALIFYGEYAQPQTIHAFSDQIKQVLGRTPLHIAGASAKISRIAWCTGGAQSYMEHVIDRNFDAFISGEVSEYTTHMARETGIHYFSAGHHATERYGVQALGAHLADTFGIEHQFIDIPNPV